MDYIPVSHSHLCDAFLYMYIYVYKGMYGWGVLCIIAWHGLNVVCLSLEAMVRPEVRDGQQRTRVHAFFISNYLLLMLNSGPSGSTQKQRDL